MWAVEKVIERSGVSVMRFKVTCFFREEPERLFTILSAKHFQRRNKDTVIWTHRKNTLEIVPFSHRGRETNGYRCYFEGNTEVFQYAFDNLSANLQPTITGIECTIETGKPQQELVRLAEKAGYHRCSMYGLYEKDGVGIVLLKNGEVNFQLRNRHFSVGRLHETIRLISKTYQHLVREVPQQNQLDWGLLA